MKNLGYKIVILFVCIALLCLATYSVAFAENAHFETSAKSAVVMERSSGRVLFSKNENAHLPIASTTKIVTALTVLRHVELDEVVEIPAEACGIEGSSIYLRAGEHLTVKELLYGLMLRSGNDAATALALYVGGSVERFADMMNGLAAELNLRDCHFANPHGLHDEQHYCSANDLAVLTREALCNEDFCKIVSTKTARIANEGYDYDRVLVNKNKLLNSYDCADGVKTGYTKKAGRCFVGSATRHGMQVIVVVLNCGPMFEETASMLNEAFANYKLETIIPLNKQCGSLKENGVTKYYVCPERIQYPLADKEVAATEIVLNEDVRIIRVFVNKVIVFEKELIEM